jgi:hypothetical protein
MSPAELAVLLRVAAHRSVIIEYGCGGSTLALLGCHPLRMASVDSDPQWIAALKEHDAVRMAISTGILSMIHGDIGPIREWGNPRDMSRVQHWHRYISAPWSVVGEQQVDVVLVDGRFRVACSIFSLLCGNDKTQIVIHDFWDRPKYHSLLSFADVVERADTLAVLRRQAKLSMREIMATLGRFSLLPDDVP